MTDVHLEGGHATSIHGLWEQVHLRGRDLSLPSLLPRAELWADEFLLTFGLQNELEDP